MFPYLHIFGRTVGSYGVCMVLGVLLVGFLAIRQCGRQGLPREDIFIVGAFALSLALVFGNLLYVAVTYPMADILARIRNLDFSFLGSGIVFYGGLLGGILGTVLGSRVARCKVSHMIRVIVPYIPLGHGIGRIGCFLAGCCHGAAYSGFLAVYYPNSVLGLSPEQGYFPVQLLEAALNGVICVLLVRMRERSCRSGTLLFAYLSMYAVTRFCLEFLRGDLARGIWQGFSLSQWISLGLLAVSLPYLLIQHKKKAAL